MLLCLRLFLFLGYVQLLIQDSICDFMAYAYTSVNTPSAKYNRKDRQYNYTIAKISLEKIMFYKILLEKKNEVLGHMEHLVNGMQKLKAAAFQVNCESHNLFFHSL